MMLSDLENAGLEDVENCIAGRNYGHRRVPVQPRERLGHLRAEGAWR